MTKTKEQMITAIKTAGISDEYAERLEAMSEDEVELEYVEFGRLMKD